MKQCLLIITLFMFMSVLCYSLTNENNLQKLLTASIDRELKRSLYQGVNMGIVIQSVDGKKTVYNHDAERLYIPASAFKVIPSAVALIKFGPDYRFETPILINGDVENGTLKGDIYLVGKGDPSLTLSDWETTADELIKQGIRSISGNIVFDLSFLDQEENRFGNNARHLYAPPCALTINYNWIILNLKDGPPATLKMIPETGYAQLKYKIQVSRSEKPGMPPMLFTKKDWGDSFSVFGTVTEWDKRYQYLRLGVSRPGLYAATLFKETLLKKGISFNGRLQEGTAPEKAKTLLKIKTKTLREAVAIMNQESNNVIAEMLTKDLGAYFHSVPGTREKGIEVMCNFCEEQIGLAPDSFKMGDGSGLSMDNRISANQFAQMLNYFYKDPKIREAFIPTLAWQGHHPHASNPVPPDNIKIWVKSGTLPGPGVNSLVGYIILEDKNEAYSFAILANRAKRGEMAYSGTLTNPVLRIIVETLKKY
jgi:D-alanyl-D-alanine carboxypeptidase/D-alanyl-D-alanine-endopeptidase (penicillin-binding protein 4)